MATILMTWELGSGLGHLMRLRPLAHALADRGHQVVLALKDLSHARSVFGCDDRLTFQQAPFKAGPPSHVILPTLSFAHILHNVGFESQEELTTLTTAWRSLYRRVRPDLIIFDHSPSALLAARGETARKCLVGTGFLAPPDQTPLPNLCPWNRADPEQLLRDELRILTTMNGVLASWAQPPLERITQLYAQVDESFLMTFAELDHYPKRDNGTYWGTWNNTTGERPQWPARGRGAGLRRIYAYLKPFPQLPDVLRLFKGLGHPTIAYVPGIDSALREQFTCPTFRIEACPLDLRAVSEECDLAILNGNHASTACMLLAGKPTLHLPLFLEQSIMAKVVAGLGAGLEAEQGLVHEVAGRLQQLLVRGSYAEVARRFAEKYRAFDPDAQLVRIVDRIERLAAAGSP